MAGKQPIIADGGLAQSKVLNLTSDLAARALQADLISGLAGKQNVVTDNSLEVRHVRFLQDSLDGKQALLSDVPGTGISLLLGARLRKVFGHGGIAVTHSLNPLDVNDPINFQVRVSGAELQSSIATLSATVADVSDGLTVVEQALDALSQAAPSASSLLPNTGPATFTGALSVTGALSAGSLETGHGLLTPRIVAPASGDLVP